MVSKFFQGCKLVAKLVNAVKDAYLHNQLVIAGVPVTDVGPLLAPVLAYDLEVHALKLVHDIPVPSLGEGRLKDMRRFVDFHGDVEWDLLTLLSLFDCTIRAVNHVEIVRRLLFG